MLQMLERNGAQPSLSSHIIPYLVIMLIACMSLFLHVGKAKLKKRTFLVSLVVVLVVGTVLLAGFTYTVMSTDMETPSQLSH
jgi:hypothetical protein